MKTKSTLELTSLYDALRLLEKAKSALYAGNEPMLASRIGGMSREVEIEIERWEVVACRTQLQSMKK